MRYVDKTNQRFGKLTVLHRVRIPNEHRVAYLCRCDCGEEVTMPSRYLREVKNRTRSCGCHSRDMAAERMRLRNQTHGRYYTIQWQIFHSAKCRAKKKGLPFAITIDDVVVPEVCPLLGIPLERGMKGFNANSPSLDRIIPEKGYVKGNVWVISMRANSIKRDATLEELITLTDNLQKKWDIFPDGKEIDRT